MVAEDSIIQKYCGDIQKRISACRTKSVAELLKDRLCNELDQGCQSEMIKNIMRKHVDELIIQVFDQDGKNKKLEAPHEAKEI